MIDSVHYFACGSCGHTSATHQAMCPRCWASMMTQRTASGAGTVYTATRVYVSLPDDRWKDDLPYDVGLVTLPEGVTLLAHLQGFADVEQMIGSRVWGQVVNGVPVFRPADAPDQSAVEQQGMEDVYGPDHGREDSCTPRSVRNS